MQLNKLKYIMLAMNFYSGRAINSGSNDAVLSRSTTQLYEEPVRSGGENYELTQCPAYESVTCTSKPQPTELQVDLDSDYI